MVITLYKNSSDNNVIDKVLTDPLIIEGHLRDSSNIETPNINLQGTVKDYNYCYIPNFYRYYYIENITLQGKITVISCEVDVLMTYKDDIRNSYGLMTKGINFNPYYDGGYQNENRDTYRQFNFQNPFNAEGNIILVTAAVQTS